MGGPGTRKFPPPRGGARGGLAALALIDPPALRRARDRRRAGKGFTLIEMLIVIAVISLLASILVPVLSDARRRARLSICLGNLRHITPAGYLYSADNGGLWPVIPVVKIGDRIALDSFNYGGKTSSDYWKTRYGGRNYHTIVERPLNPYVLGGPVSPDPPGRRREVPIYRCPSDSGTLQRRFWRPDPPLDTSITCYDDVGTTYQINLKWWMIGPHDAERWGRLRDLFGRVQQTDRFVWLCDEKMDFVANTGYSQEGDHGGLNRAAAAFLDGHAEYLDVVPGAAAGPSYVLTE